MSLLSMLRPPLEDTEIVDLYWQRDERAIGETDKKYRKYLLSVAHNFLCSQEDCEECVNDAYMSAWERIPPTRPDMLKAFLTTIIRRIAINKFNEMSRQKRIPSNITDSLDGLENYIPERTFLNEIDEKQLGKVINDYLSTLSKRQRYIFMSRYYIADSIDKIADELSVSRSTVNKEIAAIKDGLKIALEREGYKV